MKILRTPDHAFRDLPEFPYEPHYVDVPGPKGIPLRMAYVEVGPPDGPTVLLLHGEPTWSFLYRKMIPPLAAAGYRVIAPDLIGFGRSDKPGAVADHTYARHVDWMDAFLQRLALEELVLFGHDWGGLIGLRLVARHPHRFARVAVANTGLPTGQIPPNQAFLRWQQYVATAPKLAIGRIVQSGCLTQLPPEVQAAYEAPFPDPTFQAGPRAMPALVPTRADDPEGQANRQVWQALERWDRPFLTLFSDGDPITRGGERPFQERVPGARGQPHALVEGAGHFLQEDRGEEVAERLLAWLGPAQDGPFHLGSPGGLATSPPEGAAGTGGGPAGPRTSLHWAVEATVERIRREGRNLGRGILKVDGFVNHQLDPRLAQGWGEAFAQAFESLGVTQVTKVVTAEVSGIAPALATGMALGVPVVYARKKRPITMPDGFYFAEAPSHTKGGVVRLMISPEYLTPEDRVLLIDDFLASGLTIDALARLILQCGATLLGIGCVIEKAFEEGRRQLAHLQVPIVSLAVVEQMEGEAIHVRPGL